MSENLLSPVVRYHLVTKHNHHRYARGPGYMDWDNQPDPFRNYSGAPVVQLPVILEDDSPPYRKIFSSDPIASSPINAKAISRFLELSLAISAWKQAGDSRWALRSNPSSGNLHPTEGYLILSALEGIHSASGIYHYLPKDHGLERRLELSEVDWLDLMKEFPGNSFMAGLTSIHWREAWKYGERAFRYCQHDIGHALAAYRIAAAVLGWNLVVLEAVDDHSLSRLFGLDQDSKLPDAEREHPDLLTIVFPDSSISEIPMGLNREVIERIASTTWMGTPNRLSQEHVPWDIIVSAAEATLKPKISQPGKRILPAKGPGISFNNESSLRRVNVSARQIIRQRRSAVSFDGITSISSREFYTILLHTRQGRDESEIPYDSVSWAPQIHFCMFVHRVRGLVPGLYFLVRNPEALDLFVKSTKEKFIWKKPEDCPEGLDLYLLEEGNFQQIAAQVSCTQEIAGQSAFSLGMIAHFLPPIAEQGDWFYRRLFWESGMVGQMLYLAGEYIGMRGTGIGCYFDDPVHELLGFKDQMFQSLYHFTIGGPIEDTRLTTHPAYPWSCEIPNGRFIIREGGVLGSVAQEKIRPLPPSSTVLWNGIKLSRLGAGLSGFSNYKTDHKNALDELLLSPVNVLETSPDETEGMDEVLIGNRANKMAEQNGWKADGIVFMVRSGMILGRTERLVHEMKKRNRPFEDIVELRGGKKVCLHPEFLHDRLIRSLHRLGLKTLDLFFIRIPLELGSVLGAEECMDRIHRAGRFLQGQCDSGKLNGFGLSSQGLLCASDDRNFLSLDKLFSRLKDFPGFNGIEFHANFLEPGFSLKPVIEMAKGNGLTLFSESPLRARVNGEERLLVDVPPAQKGDADDEKEVVLQKLKIKEEEIHATVLADGRTIEEMLRQSGIPSPFKGHSLIEHFFGDEVESKKKFFQMDNRLGEMVEQIKFLVEQMVRAGLWDDNDKNDAVSEIQTLLSEARNFYRMRLRIELDDGIDQLREQYFPGTSPSVSLQALGIQWLWDQGIDVVLNGMRHPSYVQEACKLMQENGLDLNG